MASSGSFCVTALLAATVLTSGLLLALTSRGRATDESPLVDGSRAPPAIPYRTSVDTVTSASSSVASRVDPTTEAGIDETEVRGGGELPEVSEPVNLPSTPSAVVGEANKTACMAAMYPALCHNRGSDHCQWRPSPCGFSDHVDLTRPLTNRTVVFRGDSTLRELFSMFTFFNCDGSPNLTKKDANWTFRTSHERLNKRTRFRTAFKFDYELHHLDETLAWHNDEADAYESGKAADPIVADAVVLALGMYNAKNFSKNLSEVRYPLADIPLYAPKIVQNVCEQHRAKFGIFYAQTMECRAMSKNKAAAVKRNAAICRPSWDALQGINAHVYAATMITLNGTSPFVVYNLTESGGPLRVRRCPVYFIPSYRCYGPGFFCTHDGVHGRSHSNYIKTKVNILQNALRLLLT